MQCRARLTLLIPLLGWVATWLSCPPAVTSRCPVSERSLSLDEIVASVSPDAPLEEVESVIVEPQATIDGKLDFARSVARGLTDTPPWLHSRFLYDERGSQLFEEICEQPEYYLTRSEAEILERHA